jgi:hypothetical protein
MWRGNEIHLAEASGTKLVRAIDEGAAERALRRQQAVNEMPCDTPNMSSNDGHTHAHTAIRYDFVSYPPLTQSERKFLLLFSKRSAFLPYFDGGAA